VILPKISVVGLGKLGSPLLACAAAKGFSTVGYDVNDQVSANIRKGESPVLEPGLQSLMSANRSRIKVADNYQTVVRETSVTFITVPTPSNANGRFSVEMVLQAVRALGKSLVKKNSYHLVVVVSTVLPGDMRQNILVELEQASSKKCGKDFGLCYNPAFIALGNVIHDLLNPDFVLIGESDQRAGKELADFYEVFCDNKPNLLRMNWVNAELAKIAINTYVTTKISFANMLAEMSEVLPNADVEVVTKALANDRRINPAYFRGALGYGGPCFPRDNLALGALAKELGLQANIAEATDQINRRQAFRVIKRIEPYLKKQTKVLILGMSYKPKTNVIESSQSIDIVNELLELNALVEVYDPLALEAAKQKLGHRVLYANSLEQGVRKADIIILATPDQTFLQLMGFKFKSETKKVLLDCWRLLDEKRLDKSIQYLALGRGRTVRKPA